MLSLRVTLVSVVASLVFVVSAAAERVKPNIRAGGESRHDRVRRATGFRSILRLVLSSGLVVVGLILPSTATAQAPPTLTGEFLSSATQATITSFACDNTGGTLSYSVSGVAAGPYLGTFTETGTVTLGPRDIEIPGAPGQFRAPITSFDASFTITSALGTVTGTKTMIAPSAANFGGCNASPAAFIPSTAQIIASDLRYEATLPDGSVDRGRTFANFNASTDPQTHPTALEFREGFTSDQLVTPPPPPPPPPTPPLVCPNDADGDGLDDEDEVLFGTIVNDADSDDDGSVDGNDDSDGDGVDDEDEDDSLDPCARDDDGDGVDDEDEDD